MELALSSLSSWSLISENIQDKKRLPFSFYLLLITECYQISDNNNNALSLPINPGGVLLVSTLQHHVDVLGDVAPTSTVPAHSIQG